MPQERPSGLVQFNFLLGADEAQWLKTVANGTKLTQGDLVRLAVIKLRKEMGAASRVKRDAVLESGKAVKWTPVKRGGRRKPAA